MLPSGPPSQRVLSANRNSRVLQLLFGHSKIESTMRHLGIEVDDPIEIAEKIDI